MTRRSKQSLHNKKLKQIIMGAFPYMLAHTCGFPALYLQRMPADGEEIKPENTIFPNGAYPIRGETAKCFKCKKDLTHDDFDPENIRRVL